MGSGTKGVVLLFDDDPQEKPRIESVLGGDYEVICEASLHQCAKDENRIRRVLKDLDSTRLKAIVVDLIDSTNGPKEGRPGERIFRWMRELYPAGGGIPVVVLSVLVDDSGRVKDDQLSLSHLNQFADAVISKKKYTEDRYKDLRDLLKTEG
jgi:hypothetical protein